MASNSLRSGAACPLQDDANLGSGRQVDIEVLGAQRLRHVLTLRIGGPKCSQPPRQLAEGGEHLQVRRRADRTFQEAALCILARSRVNRTVTTSIQEMTSHQPALPFLA